MNLSLPSNLRRWFYLNVGKQAWDRYIKNVKATNRKSLVELLNKLPQDEWITAPFSWFELKEVNFWCEIQAKYETRRFYKTKNN